LKWIKQMAITHWRPDRNIKLPEWPVPKLAAALWRGMTNRCPVCGESRLFSGYIRVVPECASCHAPLSDARADDAPPYFTIVLAGHIIVPLMLITQRDGALSALALTAIFVPLSLLLTLLLLRPVKGATVGLVMRLGIMKDHAPS
jgi:uncharacterized protein (DUF983 family)